VAVGPGPILMSHDALTVKIFTECLVNIFALRQSFCLLLSATSCVWYENVNELYGNILSLIHVTCTIGLFIDLFANASSVDSYENH